MKNIIFLILSNNTYVIIVYYSWQDEMSKVRQKIILLNKTFNCMVIIEYSIDDNR